MMNGKQLKAWANTLTDDAVVEFRPYNYGDWSGTFFVRTVNEFDAYQPDPVPTTGAVGEQ